MDIQSLNTAESESIYIIDDDKDVLRALQLILETSGYEVTTSDNAAEALVKLKEKPSDIVLCDLKMPDMDGLEFLREFQAQGCESAIIMISAYGTLDLAIKAIELGAHDYIAKPFNGDEILLSIKKVQERRKFEYANRQLQENISKRYSFTNIVAQSASLAEIFETIRKIADYKTTVMIYGESGTGKELIARALHYNSIRKNKRFVAINCGAIPENLLESELFGHKKGSFTDATRDKKGLFEEAQGGTIFLDEVGELPVHLQVKLLRVLQENEIHPVGDERPISIDVRIVAATLRDLETDIMDGRFRDDLYYRLNVISLRIPPLRDRKEDIPVLVEHFLKKHQEKLGIPAYEVDEAAMGILMQHEWRGNVRELENCIERAMILAESNTITPESLPKAITKDKSADTSMIRIPDSEFSIKVHTRALEEMLIKRALEKTNGNRTHAAKLLEISHRTLLYKLKEYKLTELHK